MTSVVALIRRRSTLVAGASNASIYAVPQRVGLRRARPTNATLPALSITGTPPSGAPIGSPYTFTPTASGDIPPYTFSYTGPLPPGLSFDPDTGTISGEPL